MKLLIFPKRTYLVKDTSKDFHCVEGQVSKADFQSDDGTLITTKSGKTARVFEAQFIDIFTRMPRQAQIMLPKDISWILGVTGVNSKSKIVDAGSGSGACACFLSQYVKHVYSYDVREDHIERSQKNAELLQRTNITFENESVALCKQKNIDLFVLDLPDPAVAVQAVQNCLKPGGFVVLYQPQVTQMQQTLAAYADFQVVKTVELIEREWVIDEKRSRPAHGVIGHTAFLSVLRKMQ